MSSGGSCASALGAILLLLWMRRARRVAGVSLSANGPHCVFLEQVLWSRGLRAPLHRVACRGQCAAAMAHPACAANQPGLLSAGEGAGRRPSATRAQAARLTSGKR